MFWHNWAKNTSEYKGIELPKMINTPEKDTDEQNLYLVGRTNNGKTVLRLSSPDGISLSLTMNGPATRQLIKLLDATLTDEGNENE